MLFADLGEVSGGFAAAEPGFRVGGENRDEGSTLRATNVPCPGLDSSRPSSVSRLMASLTVFREASYSRSARLQWAASRSARALRS